MSVKPSGGWQFTSPKIVLYRPGQRLRYKDDAERRKTGDPVFTVVLHTAQGIRFKEHNGTLAADRFCRV